MIVVKIVPADTAVPGFSLLPHDIIIEAFLMIHDDKAVLWNLQKLSCFLEVFDLDVIQ